VSERRSAPDLAAPPPGSATPSTPPTAPPPAGRLRRVVRHPAFRVALGAALVGAVVLGVGFMRCGVRGCPDVQRLVSYSPGGAPVLLDRQGRSFGDLAPVEGELVTLKSLPKHVPQAFMAVEDRRFYEHGAVDWRRVAGALWANVRSRKVEEGSSTITMQLARNVFPDRIPGQERTLSRKLLEVRVAMGIEHSFEKDQILEMYLNHIYFGNGARGIEAAARHYFGVRAKDLTLPQAALLAALPKGPGHYDPRKHPGEARTRRDLVLSLMAEQDRIPAADAERARKAPLGVRRRRVAGDKPVFAGYFVEEVRRQLEEVMGGDLYDQHLRIRTTLDIGAQRAAEEELDRQLRQIESGGLGRFSRQGDGSLQGAVVMVGALEGDVLAWVGGRDFRESRFDRVRGARRQAGSAFKPFVYATALDNGHTLSEPLSDEPLKLDRGGRRFWEPHNFDGRFEGTVTLRDALVRSKNVPTIRLAQQIGTHAVAAFAEEAGIEPPISEEPSMALGTVAVSPLELTAAYTAFAHLGTGVRPRVVLQVERPDGEVVWASEVESRRVLNPGTAYLVTDALSEALRRGTGTAVRQAGFQGPAAGKTGTTNDGADAWFVGYNPEVVATVWIGFDRMQPIVPKATGGRLAAPVWARLMQRYYQGHPAPRPWAQPEGIVAVAVDPATGLTLSPGCMPLAGAPYREIFSSSLVPPSSCPTRGDMAPVEDPYEFEMMDDEIVDAPMDLEPLPLETPEEVRAELEAEEGPAVPEPPPPPAAAAAPAPASTPAATFYPPPPPAPASRPPAAATPRPAPAAPPEPEATPRPEATARPEPAPEAETPEPEEAETPPPS
jgi:penicillin-binding protein 1A